MIMDITQVVDIRLVLECGLDRRSAVVANSGQGIDFRLMFAMFITFES